MNKATLQRFYHDKVTFGKLTFEWLPELPVIYTIEPAWHENKPLISCIPQGLYNVVPHNTKIKPNTFRLLNIPGRTGILIHEGNYACEVMIGKSMHKVDTEGCILIGLDYDKKVPMLKQSVKALDLLRENIKGNWCIEIKNFSPKPEIK